MIPNDDNIINNTYFRTKIYKIKIAKIMNELGVI